MKKITLAIALISICTQAQTFPSPYCDLDSGSTTEEITSITFGETIIENSNTSDALIDFTSTNINITSGQTYSIVVEGNTYGPFDTNIVAYIDWNQNGVLDDSNEVYPIGTLSNSTGGDGVSVSADITVPAEALEGTTRIRVTKTYTDSDSVAVEDPCAISMSILDYGIFAGFGQAIDFSLTIGAFSVDEFDASALSVYPTPTKDFLNIEYKTPIEAIHLYNLIGQEVLSKVAEATKSSLDLSSLESGAYIVKIITKDGQHNLRIIKQ